jgi:hypothetical protein
MERSYLPKTSHVRRVEYVKKDSQKSVVVFVKEFLGCGTATPQEQGR